jgi:hypothetical protein
VGKIIIWSLFALLTSALTILVIRGIEQSLN